MNEQLARGVVHCSTNPMRSTMYAFQATTTSGTCDGVVRANSVDDALDELRKYFAKEPLTISVRLTCVTVTRDITL
jgi:hypothetical protein